MRSPVAELLRELGAALLIAGTRWYLFGAQAALLHGAARLTADVDITVDLADCRLSDLLSILGRAGFSARVSEIEEFAERHRVIPVVHEPSGIGVDIVLAGSGLEDAFFERAENQTVEGVRVPVASAEDLITMKILAGRPKDLDDAIAILAARCDDLDLAIIRDTLRALEEALDRSDLLAQLDSAVASARKP